MNCQQAQAELSAYIDGELPPATRAEVEAHIGSCQACQKRVAELRKLGAGMAALPKSQPAPQFLAAVKRKIARRETVEQASWVDALFRPAWLKIPIEAAALVAILITTFIWITPHRRTDAPQTLAMNREQAASVVRNEAPTGTSASPAGPSPMVVWDPAAKAKDDLAKAAENSANARVIQAQERLRQTSQSAGEPVAKTAALAQERKESDARTSTALPSDRKAAPSAENTPNMASSDISQSSFGLATPVPGISGSGGRQPSETILVQGKDPVTARAYVEVVTADFGGRVASSRQAGTGMESFFVEVPSARVAIFKARIAARFAQTPPPSASASAVAAAPVAQDKTPVGIAASAPVAIPMANGQSLADRAAAQGSAPTSQRTARNEAQVAVVGGTAGGASLSKQALEPEDPLPAFSPATTLVEVQVVITER